MKFRRLTALLPCQSIEDFELRRKDEDAEQLLAACSVLWHPVLLADSQTIPGWSPAASPPPDLAECLIVVPDCCRPLLPENWHSEAVAAGACVLFDLRCRDEMLAAVLERFLEGRVAEKQPVDPDLAADFLALGYCRLQVELLTRKLHYMSNLDESALRTAAVAAADAAVRGETAAARERLQTAFDRLHDAREYAHPVAPRLLDLTLLAPSTLGKALREELADRRPRNLLVSGEVVAEMARHEPETLDRLKRALADGTAELLGGEFTESPLPLLEPEAIRRNLVRGLAAYQEHCERRPVVFGRRRFGLTPVLPQILKQLGFAGAFHCTLDDGRFPTADQSRIEWEGIDGTTIESIGSVPIDANRAGPFLQLAESLGDVMNSDCAVVLAHWPGQTCVWHDDLRRIAAYGDVLGAFFTFTGCLNDVSVSSRLAPYKPDEYRSPYLRQDAAAGRRDPISRWVRYFQRRAMLEASESLATLAALCGSATKKKEDASEAGSESPGTGSFFGGKTNCARNSWPKTWTCPLRVGRGLVHFSAGKRIAPRNSWLKTWTCPLRVGGKKTRVKQTGRRKSRNNVKRPTTNPRRHSTFDWRPRSTAGLPRSRDSSAASRLSNAVV